MHGIDRELRELFEMGECRHDRAPVGRMLDGTPPVQPEPLVKESRTLVKDLVKDAISRQAAIDAVNSHFGFSVEEEYGSAVQEVLNALPSVQPELAIPLQWIEAQIEWLKSLGNGFSTLAAGQISAMVDKWKEEQDG